MILLADSEGPDQTAWMLKDTCLLVLAQLKYEDKLYPLKTIMNKVTGKVTF